MTDTLAPLIGDLVTWCAATPRSYAQALEAWRTSCPRLTVWEEAMARGYLETCSGPDGLVVTVTDKGRAMVATAIRARASAPRAPMAAIARSPIELAAHHP